MTDAHDAYRRERDGRNLRRDRSPIPLTDIERAERRHERIQGLWRQAFLWTPIAASVAFELMMGGLGVAAIVTTCAMGVAMVLARVVILHVIGGWMRNGPSWIGAHAFAYTLAGAATVIYTSVGVVQTQTLYQEIPVAVLSGLALALWPWVYRALRWRYPSDYERMVWATYANEPTGIVE